jgi:hypothetical protein
VRNATVSKRKIETSGVELGTGLAAAVGVVSVAAGIIHLLAAREHVEHPLVAAFFVSLACAQFAWGALVVWRRSRIVLTAGIAGNLAVVGIWVLSRTTGIPIMDATRDVEAVGFADGVATLFELVSALGAGLLLSLPTVAVRAVLPRLRAQRLIAGTAAVAMVLTVPAFLTDTEGHAHDDAHVLGATQVNDSLDGHTHEATAAIGRTSAPSHAHKDVAATSTPADHVHDEALARTGDGAVHVHDAGQQHGTHNHASKPAPTSTRSEAATAPPMPKPRGRVAEVLYGPFPLPAVDSGGQAHYNRIMPALPAPCVNCMVTMMSPDLVYADGSSANLSTGPMLHHTVLFDPMREDPTCSRSNGGGAVGMFGHRVFASGNERTTMIMPDGYAMPVRSPWWAGIFEIMNHAQLPKLVFFRLTVRYLPMDDPSVKPVTPIWMDVDNCGDSQFAVPKGRSVSTWKWTSTLTGRIVAAGGHVHDGGTAITLRNASRGARMCTSHAAYGTKPEFMGAIDTMSICPHDRIGVVKAGEELAIDAYYNTMRPAGDVMGIMMAYVYETNDLTGGQAPPPYYTAAPPEDAPPPQSGGGHGH